MATFNPIPKDVKTINQLGMLSFLRIKKITQSVGNDYSSMEESVDKTFDYRKNHPTNDSIELGSDYRQISKPVRIRGKSSISMSKNRNKLHKSTKSVTGTDPRYRKAR